MTPLGQLPFFIEYLKQGGSVRRLGGGLPAGVQQPERAAQARSAGHRAAVGSGGPSALRPHHGAAVRRVNPRLLGMSKVVSEDAVRRDLGKIEEAPG